jgi:hypothetical protein
MPRVAADEDGHAQEQDEYNQRGEENDEPKLKARPRPGLRARLPALHARAEIPHPDR